MKTHLFFILFFFCFLPSAFAQKDSAIDLHEVQISDSRLAIFTTGLNQYSYDSTLLASYNNTSISDLLNENSAMYLKTYGPGALSTTSLRGGSSYHTSVLWNGFSIANSMNGLCDLSLEKNIFFEDVVVQYGGTSSLWGSGAVSGTIHLINHPDFNSGLLITAGASAGSFSNFTQFGKISFGLKNISASLRFFNTSDKNNFTYIDKNSCEETEQVNSSIKQNGVMADVSYLAGKNSILNFRAWYSYSDRQIPPATSVVNSEGMQKDISSRYSLEWKTTARILQISVRSAYFEDKINYSDNFFLKPSVSISSNFISEAEIKINLTNNQIVQLGIDNNFSHANTTDYVADVNLNRISFFASWNYQSDNEKITTSAGIRKEFSSLENSPFIYSGGANYAPFKFLRLNLAASKVYRNPTLNDLYWNPGGNKSLKPENGFTAETGFNLNINTLLNLKENNFPQINIETTVYYKNINDWIVWNPLASAWSAENLKLVKSKGTESSIHLLSENKKIKYGGDFEFFYTISTNEKTELANDASLHCQLTYVPEYRWNLRAFAIYHNFGLRINYSYTGYRYITTDNSEYLQPFSLCNIQADKIFSLSKSQFKLFVRVNNVFNEDYEAILNRPMPLRSYEAGLTYTFRKNYN